jgi:hypothetical protein
MTGNPFLPQYLIARQAELQQVSQILAKDGDLLLAGVPGIGRHTLIRAAAGGIGAKVLEIDCLRATNASRFLELLAQGLVEVFSTPAELALNLDAQVRVLESLALDPTDSPHSRDYVKKHQLSRGGGLQGALAGLEQKGLVYWSKYGYQIAIPFLAYWLRRRLA